MVESDLIGRELGGFRIDEVHASDGWNAICFGHSSRFEAQKVVIRVLDPRLEAEHPKLVQKFTARCARAALATHPAFVEGFGVGRDTNLIFTVSPRLRLPTVADMIDYDGQMEESRAIEIVTYLAGALEHAAEKGVIPVGLCPSEILVAPGNTARITNLCWPLWVIVDEIPDGPPIESACFAAPERENRDHRADIYSLGALLHYMLSGERPFHAPTTEELRAKHLNEELAPLRSSGREVSQVTSDLVLQMTAGRPNERPQTYQNVARWLEAATFRSRTIASHELAQRHRKDLAVIEHVEEVPLPDSPHIPRVEIVERQKAPVTPVIAEAAPAEPDEPVIKTVLVVDDNPGQLLLMANLLRRNGYQCIQAADGSGAVTMARSKKPHLILLDVIMGDDDGYNACRKLKRDPVTRDIPVVFVTSKSDEMDRYWGTRLGAVAYVSKPVDPDGVIQTVKSLIGGPAAAG